MLYITSYTPQAIHHMLDITSYTSQVIHPKIHNMRANKKQVVHLN